MRRIVAGAVLAIAAVSPAHADRSSAAPVPREARAADVLAAAVPGEAALASHGLLAPDPALAAPVALGRTDAPTRWLALQVFGYTVIGGVLVAGALAGVGRLATGRAPGRRAATSGGAWWRRWRRATRPASDEIELVSRRWLGARESLGVVRVGDERFLVGITGTGISLLSRLAGDDPARPPVTPADFDAALTRAATKTAPAATTVAAAPRTPATTDTVAAVETVATTRTATAADAATTRTPTDDELLASIRAARERLATRNDPTLPAREVEPATVGSASGAAGG
jgi:hypothetical protein